MKERRRGPRKPVRYVPLRAPTSGQVVDLGPGGLQVETDRALAVGWQGQFMIGEMRRRVRFQGVVRWCRMHATHRIAAGEVNPVFRAGIAFLGLAGELPPDLVE